MRKGISLLRQWSNSIRQKSAANWISLGRSVNAQKEMMLHNEYGLFGIIMYRSHFTPTYGSQQSNETMLLFEKVRFPFFWANSANSFYRYSLHFDCTFILTKLLLSGLLTSTWALS